MKCRPPSRKSNSNAGVIALTFRLVTAWFLSVGINQAYSQAWVIDSNTVIDANSEIPRLGIELIDGDQPPTVVDIMEGGDVRVVRRGPQKTRTLVRGSSILNIVGGNAQAVATYDSSTLNVVSGSAGAVEGVGISANDNSQVNISGGYVGGGSEATPIRAKDNSIINVFWR